MDGRYVPHVVAPGDAVLSASALTETEFATGDTCALCVCVCDASVCGSGSSRPSIFRRPPFLPDENAFPRTVLSPRALSFAPSSSTARVPSRGSRRTENHSRPRRRTDRDTEGSI